MFWDQATQPPYRKVVNWHLENPFKTWQQSPLHHNLWKKEDGTMALLGYLPPTQSFQVSLEDCEVNYERNWILTSQTSHLIIFLPLLLILFFLFVALIIFAVLRGRLFRIIPVGGKTLVENTDLGQRSPKKGKVPHKLWQLFPLHRLDRFHAKGREPESRPGHRKQNENLSFNRVSPLSDPKPSGYDY